MNFFSIHLTILTDNVWFWILLIDIYRWLPIFNDNFYRLWSIITNNRSRSTMDRQCRPWLYSCDQPLYIQSQIKLFVWILERQWYPDANGWNKDWCKKVRMVPIKNYFTRKASVDYFRKVEWRNGKLVRKTDWLDNFRKNIFTLCATKEQDTTSVSPKI